VGPDRRHLSPDLGRRIVSPGPSALLLAVLGGRPLGCDAPGAGGNRPHPIADPVNPRRWRRPPQLTLPQVSATQEARQDPRPLSSSPRPAVLAAGGARVGSEDDPAASNRSRADHGNSTVGPANTATVGGPPAQSRRPTRRTPADAAASVEASPPGQQRPVCRQSHHPGQRPLDITALRAQFRSIARKGAEPASSAS
jgi:hypothetical protein